MDFDQICHSIRAHITSRFQTPRIQSNTSQEPEDDFSKQFLDRHVARDVLNQQTLRDWYMKFCEAYPDFKVPDIEADSFAERVKKAQLQPFFATLIYARCPPRAIQSSTRKLLQDSSRSDQGELPLTELKLRELFDDDEVSVSDFRVYQPPFCTLVIRKGQQIIIENPSDRRLPYMKETYIDEGTFGAVYKVEIAPGHLEGNNSRENGNPEEIARKDCADLSIKEWEINDRIRNSDVKSKNILKTFGSLRLGNKTLSIFMDLANCNLTDHLKKGENHAPKDTQVKIQTLTAAAGLARGLSILHRAIPPIVHRDLKPSNVLVFYGESGQMMWKISDFGMSSTKSDSAGDQGTDYVREERSSHPQSGIRNVSGTTEYRAPETMGGGNHTTTQSDVWSLGCIISVLFVSLIRGKAAVAEYLGDRSRQNASSADATFFSTPKLALSGSELNKAVAKAHSDLLYREKTIELKPVLEFLEKKILSIKKNDRITADEVDSWLRGVVKKYEKSTESHGPGEQPQVGETRHLIPFWRRHASTPSVTRTSPVFPEIWAVPGLKDKTSCHMDFEATYIAFWGRRSIGLIFNDSELPEKGGPIKMRQTYELGSTAMASWTCVRAANRYLVASTNESSFNLHVFDFLKGANSAAPILEDQHKDVVSLHEPGIHTLAVSPKGTHLACVVNGNANAGQPPRLYYTSFLKLQDALRDQLPETEMNEIWDKSDIIEDLANNAQEITELEFISEDSLYFVTYKKTQEKYMAPEAKVILVDKLGSSRWGVLAIPRPMLSEREMHLTAVIPIPAQEKMAMILDESTLLMYRHRGPDFHSSPDRVITIKSFHVATLLPTESPDRLLGLARKHPNSPWSVIELLLLPPATTNKDEIRPWQVAKLNNFYTSRGLDHNPRLRRVEKATVGGDSSRTRIEELVIATAEPADTLKRGLCRVELHSTREGRRETQRND